MFVSTDERIAAIYSLWISAGVERAISTHSNGMPRRRFFVRKEHLLALHLEASWFGTRLVVEKILHAQANLSTLSAALGAGRACGNKQSVSEAWESLVMSRCGAAETVVFCAPFAWVQTQSRGEASAYAPGLNKPANIGEHIGAASLL